MPSKVLTIIELFGYKGDRHVGLNYLMKPGGWSKDALEPAVGVGMFGFCSIVEMTSHMFVEEEGVRRPICDMALLLFHLVFSSLTFDGIDIDMAQKILDYHRKRYPNGVSASFTLELRELRQYVGVFFLFGQGRLSFCRGQPAQAIEYYSRAVAAQDQYKNLHYISHWEIGVANLALWDVAASLTNWRVLAKEATVRVSRTTRQHTIDSAAVVEGDVHLRGRGMPSRARRREAERGSGEALRTDLELAPTHRREVHPA